MLSDIKILIWDFDGTLYRPNPDLWHDVRKGEYQTIANHTGWSREKTVEEFAKLYKTVYDSATESTAVLSGISIAEAAVEMERYFDRRKYLTRDVKLIALFQKLKNFRHFILANGVIARHKETLEVLGVSPDIFEEMVTSQTVGFTKPHEAGFRYILAKTCLPPEVHLMIGDREAVDLVPAKKLGMKTCLVWAETPSNIADITLPTVYEVATILV
jgi:putative hydrolase of the HAD superfamily